MIHYTFGNGFGTTRDENIKTLADIISFHLKMKSRIQVNDFRILEYGYYLWGIQKEDMKLTLDFASKTFHFVNTESIPFKDVINKLEQVLGEDYLEWSTAEMGHQWSTGSLAWTTNLETWTMEANDFTEPVKYNGISDLNNLTNVTL